MPSRRNISDAMIFFLAFLPALYLFIFLENSLSFSGFSNSMRSIGKILGISGMILFSLTLLLNTRIRFIEEMFLGIDKAYKAHHILGTLAFVFLLFHPLFLSAQFLFISIKASADFFTKFSDIAVTFGTLALLSMTILLGITFFAKWKYQNWKLSHQFLGISFILASFHVLLIPSDVSRNLFLRAYMIFFIIIGISSYSYRTLFWKIFVKRKNYVLTKIRNIDNITELTLTPIGNPMVFNSGQFAFLSFNDKKMKEPHPFTISSSSLSKNLVFSVKNLGDYTGVLNKLRKGTSVKVEGPYGKFSLLNHPSKKYIFITGGIGITPFLSMLRSINNAPDSFDFESIDIYYSVKKKEEAPFIKELNKISSSIKRKKIRIFLYESDKKGFLNSAYISKNTKDFKDSMVFICGPPSMMYSLKEQLIMSGINKHKINLEEFSLL